MLHGNMKLRMIIIKGGQDKGLHIVNELNLCVLHPNPIEYAATIKSQNADAKCVLTFYSCVTTLFLSRDCGNTEITFFICLWGYFALP